MNDIRIDYCRVDNCCWQRWWWEELIDEWFIFGTVTAYTTTIAIITMIIRLGVFCVFFALPKTTEFKGWLPPKTTTGGQGTAVLAPINTVGDGGGRVQVYGWFARARAGQWKFLLFGHHGSFVLEQ